FLQSLTLALVELLGCVTGTTGLIKVFGYLGGDVNVTCPYDPGYENYEKYLCKNKCDDNDVLITTTDNKNVRFSISDKKNIAKFLVTISNVTASDAGKYWCGVTRTGKDLYQEVKIQLTKGTLSHFAKVPLQGRPAQQLHRRGEEQKQVHPAGRHFLQHFLSDGVQAGGRRCWDVLVCLTLTVESRKLHQASAVR
uniref:Immunoglobulin domain-containing protein n=1 Tax=Salarias fasciatus TaxID=181472 RepID=A0A672F1J3_SALFA